MKNIEAAWARYDRRGFKQLGDGYFSVVYEHKSAPHLAIKVGPLHDGWLTWASYLTTVSPNRFLPRIHKLVRFEEAGFYVAIIDKLHETLEERMWNMKGDAYLSLKKWHHKLEWWFGCDGHGGVEHKFPKLHPEWDELEGVLAPVKAYAKAIGVRRDLHNANIMFTKEGQPVITDPFSNI
jgi:hypothetical protein